MKKILVTGGRGYIGSHAVLQLKEQGYKVIVVDDLSRSLPGNEIEDVTYYNNQMQDKQMMDKILTDNDVYAVMHFAAFISVHESTQEPEMYFENNAEGVKSLLESLKKHGVDKFIFSSTAATYGEGKGSPLSEGDETKPINPYGESKLKAESYLMNTDMSYVIFRYFNVAGADADLRTGANLKYPPTHLINSINTTALGQRKGKFSIFGTDYKTRDGTAIRDYVHVVDIARAHVLALGLIEQGKKEIINLGSGNGQTVKEVFDKSEQTLSMKIPHSLGSRREGDPAVLISSSNKARKELSWKPELSLEEMIKTDYLWRKNNIN